jgi:taurine transport system substrate-binding protein
LSTGDLNKDGYSVFNAYVVANDFAEKYPELVAAFLKDQRHLGSGY